MIKTNYNVNPILPVKTIRQTITGRNTNDGDVFVKKTESTPAFKGKKDFSSAEYLEFAASMELNIVGHEAKAELLKDMAKQANNHKEKENLEKWAKYHKDEAKKLREKAKKLKNKAEKS